VTSAGTFRRLPQLALGSRYPAKLLRRIERNIDDDAAIRAIGIDWATQQCRDLLDNGVDGIHFYTLNRSSATVEIYRRLGASDSADLAHFVESAGEGV
jgi:methylenetetrahydrofolate reductase (NADPH)